MQIKQEFSDFPSAVKKSAREILGSPSGYSLKAPSDDTSDTDKAQICAHAEGLVDNLSFAHTKDAEVQFSFYYYLFHLKMQPVLQGNIKQLFGHAVVRYVIHKACHKRRSGQEQSLSEAVGLDLAKDKPVPLYTLAVAVYQVRNKALWISLHWQKLIIISRYVK